MRLRAIVCCLWFGTMPWWVYEKSCHYQGMSYMKHLLLNYEQVLVWLFFRETEEDREFERKVNPTWAFFR
jgi:hypothetical protein